MTGNRYSSTIRKRAQQIHEDMRGHVSGAEISRMLKTEGHGEVPARSINLWLMKKTPLTPIVQRIEHQAVREYGATVADSLDTTARALLKAADAMAARVFEASKTIPINTPEDANRIADLLHTIVRSSIESARARESLGMAQMVVPKSLIDRSADCVERLNPFARLATSNFQD